MKKLFALLSVVTLVACSDNHPPQPQYQQPPVIVQQAPAQAPVVVQQDNSGAAMVAGAALGAAAAMALSDRDRGYNGQMGYSNQNQPVAQQNVTHVTQVNKTVIVNNHGPKDVPPAATAAAPAPAPTVPAPAGVNLAKDVPAAKPNYTAAGTQSPVPTMSQAALTAPKTLNLPTATSGVVPNYKPANYAQVGYNKPAALPAPKPVAPLALPAPRPAPVTPKSTYSAPKLSYSKPMAISYKPSSSSSSKK